MIPPDNLLNSSVGLDIGSESIRVVELGKFMKKIKLVKFGEEKITSSESDDLTISNAIIRLFERLKISQKHVIINIEGKGVRHLLLEAPNLSQSELTTWIREQIIKRFPASIRSQQIFSSFHIIERNAQKTKILAAFCLPKILDKKIQLVENAGLVPVMIGAGCLDLSLAFAFGNQMFFNQNLCFIHAEKRSTDFLITENGNPITEQNIDQIFSPSSKGSSDERNLIEELNHFITTQKETNHITIDRLIFVGDCPELRNDVIERFKSYLKEDLIIEKGSPLKSLLQDKNYLSPEYSFAAGLAVKKYFPLLNTIDLLPEERRKTSNRQTEKKKAQQFILGFGFLILLLMIILNIIKSVMVNRLDTTEEQMLSLNEQIFKIELTKKEQKKLYQTLEEMQQMVTWRSRYAEIMEEICKMIPVKVWFHEIDIKPFSLSGTRKKNKQSNGMTITGWAFDEEKIGDFLSKLEKSSFFNNIQLLMSERVSAKEIWERTKLRKVSLIRFQIFAGLINE
jgi:Tfp pilus assembly PilM family ATPase